MKQYDYLAGDENQKALFIFLRSQKMLPTAENIDSFILSPRELFDLVENIMKGLHDRLMSTIQLHIVHPMAGEDLEEVTLDELAGVINTYIVQHLGRTG